MIRVDTARTGRFALAWLVLLSGPAGQIAAVRFVRALGGAVVPGPIVVADGSVLAASNAGALHALDPGNARRITAAGIPDVAARQLAISIICLLEGAFILSRATRTTEPLQAAGRTAEEAARARPAAHSVDSRTKKTSWGPRLPASRTWAGTASAGAPVRSRLAQVVPIDPSELKSRTGTSYGHPPAPAFGRDGTVPRRRLQDSRRGGHAGMSTCAQ